MTSTQHSNSASPWQKLRVLLIGHTGFKGAWLSLMLKDMGAEVHGIALPPPEQGIYRSCKIQECMSSSEFIDIQEQADFENAVVKLAPDVIIHFAAQSLVRVGLAEPVWTTSVNVMGTAHVLSAAAKCSSCKALLIATSDKCYDPARSACPFPESAPLGGHEPYSASKACAEIMTWAWVDSGLIQTPVATVRAGNVIGGGDWSPDRLVPDCVRAFSKRKTVYIRNPKYIRPWQHVLDPLTGYLALLKQLLSSEPKKFMGAWNFGPDTNQTHTVEDVVKLTCKFWGPEARYEIKPDGKSVETKQLEIDSTKAKQALQWKPQWNLEQSLERTVAWYKCLSTRGDILALTRQQISEHLSQSGV